MLLCVLTRLLVSPSLSGRADVSRAAFPIHRVPSPMSSACTIHLYRCYLSRRCCDVSVRSGVVRYPTSSPTNPVNGVPPTLQV